MNFDEFEQKLRSQPRREIPSAWRDEILGPLRTTPAVASTPWWRQWLWPHPAAWAGLAVLWLAVLLLQSAARPETPAISAAVSRSGPEMLQALAERARLMAELSGEFAEPRSSPADRPRSGRAVSEVVV